jgi:hypothetical protein
MKTLILILIFSAKIFSAECDIAKLTNDCRVFDSAPAQITLPDGTSFPNPRAKLKSGGIGEAKEMSTPMGTGSRGDYNAHIALAEEDIKLKAKLSKALNSEKKITEEFKMFLLTPQPTNYFWGVVKQTDGKYVVGDKPMINTVMAPWPPNGPNQKFSQVPIKDFLELLNSDQISQNTKKEISKMFEHHQKTQALYQGQNIYAGNVEKKPDLAELAKIQKRKDRVQELFKISKDAFSKVFDKNGASADNEALRETIASLNFKFESEVSDDHKSTCKHGPNAYYDQITHTFVICDSILNYPDNQLVGIIGHEMGHSLGACSLSKGLDVVSPNILKSFIQNRSINGNDSDQAILNYVNQNLSENKVARLLNNVTLSPAFIVAAERAQLSTKKIKEIPLDANPLTKAKECLIKNSNFREVDQEDADKITENVTNVFNSHAFPVSPADKKDLQKRVDKYHACIGGVGKESETEEAMADVWGAIVMEEYLAENPPTDDLARLSLFSFFSESFCSQYREKPSFGLPIRHTNFSLYQLKQMSEMGHAQQQQNLKLKHPPNEKRLNHVYMSSPSIAKALKCDNGKNSACLDMVRNYSKYPPQSSTPGSNSSVKEVR